MAEARAAVATGNATPEQVGSVLRQAAGLQNGVERGFPALLRNVADALRRGGAGDHEAFKGLQAQALLQSRRALKKAGTSLASHQEITVALRKEAAEAPPSKRMRPDPGRFCQLAGEDELAAMSLLLPLLKALKFAKASEFNPDDLVQYQALVLWMENTKVRRYPIDGREALKAADPAAWEAGFARYLADVECPLKLESGNRRAVLQWLLAHAVGLEYQDKAAGFAAAADKAAAEAVPPEEWTGQQLPPFPDIRSEAVLVALQQVQQLLHGGGGDAGSSVSGCDGVTPQSLHAAAATLETQILPALAELSKAAAASGGGGAASGGGAPAGSAAGQAAAAALLRKYPNGLSEDGSGSPVDLAATVLRMLYIKDLRGLQTAIDAAIVQVQEFTANPRTDSALGKVGR
eukprot:scaffold9.g3222.t1